jgi:hypothetical protein
MIASSKFFVGRLSPTPYITVSKGFFNLYPYFSWLVNKTLYFTLLKSPDPSGSAKIICIFLFFYFKYLDIPAIVPPVPAEHTKESIKPLVCL